jgi:acetyl-CoA synthetase (ADP-forming)
MTDAELKERLVKLSVKKTLLEHEVKALLWEIGLNVPDFIYLNKGDALPSVIKLKFPLIAKISGVKIASKTDIKGIAFDIKGMEGLNASIESLLKINDAEGVLIEETAPKGMEVIVGGIYDAQFGPTVMFGLGGISVELFKDVAFALTPLEKQDALRLIKEVRGYRLLEGIRGGEPSDIDSLLHVIIFVSKIMDTGLVEEMDLNPVSVYPEGALILDAKLRFR